MGDVEMLVEMGFPRDRVEYALRVTNNKGVEPAMEWLLAHGDEPIPSDTSVTAGVGAQDSTVRETPSTSNTTGSPQQPEVAKSLKCDDCGKLCKDQNEVEFHAAKTGHSNFSESTEEKKPLTEEEKRQQLALIEEKLKLKRLEREEREKQEALDRERNRIKSGKDMSEARRRMEEMEMKKIVEQRKREKAEEKEARERVKAQIEADKARRKASQNLSPTADKPVASSSVVSSTTPPTEASAIKSPPKDYKETRIQVRLQDGSTLTETFNVNEQLSAVRVFIQMKTGSDSPFGLMTTFPRKVFGIDDFDKPLSALGLVPSAVLIMTKGTLDSECNRIKFGKDMSEPRWRMEEMEMKKIVEQRKREMAEEKQARERVKSQIEDDKARRKARQPLSLTADKPVASSSVVSTTSPPTEASAIKSPPKDYKGTRIQVRLQDGSTLTESFNDNEQLSAVRVFIQTKMGSDSPFGLMTTFPRKVFGIDDFDKPLSALGLVPSAVLIMTKGTLDSECNRIKFGKDMSEPRWRMEEMEMKKIVEQRKREMAEEKQARERVKSQIEDDKARRKARQPLSLTADKPVASSSVVSTTSPRTEASAIKSPPKDYKGTRIQVRLQDGSTLTESFNDNEQLSAVRVFIQTKMGSDSPFGLMTTFPRKVFGIDDFDKPLSALGLVPSAVLILTKVSM